MIGLDTNVLLRFLLDDDPVQSAVAKGIILEDATDDNPVFVNVAVMVETIWTLSTAYKVDRTEVNQIVSALLETVGLVVEHQEVISRAVEVSDETGSHLADTIIAQLNTAYGCVKTVSFDKHAARTGIMQAAQ